MTPPTSSTPTIVSELLATARGGLGRVLALRRSRSPLHDDVLSGTVCHCRRVEYATVREAIFKGATTIADLQRSTTACTRCFGCRLELERMLRLHLGASFRHQAAVTLPPEYRKAKAHSPMYMPVLAGFRGSPVDTRVVVFNLDGPPQAIPFRADLLRLDGTRVNVWNLEVADGCSSVLELTRDAVGELLPDGVGVIKLILDTEEVGSLRPYFHFETPTCVTSTHEKKGPPDPNRRIGRRYHWVFPIGVGERFEEAYFLCTNTRMEPMPGELVWTSSTGHSARTPVPTLEFDQTACVPIHEHFPEIRTGVEGGAVRLTPATHAVAGFMIRHDPRRQLWRVQHL